ncbi:MAG: anti-sigma factor family protein [Pyrinomonadaceae bacterium]
MRVSPLLTRGLLQKKGWQMRQLVTVLFYMTVVNSKLMDCTKFEDRLSDYLEHTVEKDIRKAMSTHALQCPVCHSLMNEVKNTIAACRQAAEPKPALTKLDAQILARTAPALAINCDEFEAFLTDYLDGFLAANVFHRWERHAVLCDDCTDLPGEVVRSLGALISYKSEELPVPHGLHERILQRTIGTESAKSAKASWSDRFQEWVRSFSFPISVPQLAPVAVMALFAFLFVSQTVSADGSLSDVYAKSYHLAEQTFEQSSNVWNGKPMDTPVFNKEPITGTTTVSGENANK